MKQRFVCYRLTFPLKSPFVNFCCLQTYSQRLLPPFPLHLFTFFLLDVKRANIGAKLLMRFGASIIEKYNALSEEDRDTSSILGHLVRMQAQDEDARLADVVGMSYAPDKPMSCLMFFSTLQISFLVSHLLSLRTPLQ